MVYRQLYVSSEARRRSWRKYEQKMKGDPHRKAMHARTQRERRAREKVRRQIERERQVIERCAWNCFNQLRGVARCAHCRRGAVRYDPSKDTYRCGVSKCGKPLACACHKNEVEEADIVYDLIQAHINRQAPQINRARAIARSGHIPADGPALIPGSLPVGRPDLPPPNFNY